jgi:hypothetical protein
LSASVFPTFRREIAEPRRHRWTTDDLIISSADEIADAARLPWFGDEGSLGEHIKGADR